MRPGSQQGVGPMRDLVTLQSAVTAAPSSFGEAPAEFTTIGTVYAQVLETGSREVWQAQQVQPDVTHVVVIRYYPGLTERWRLLFAGNVLEVQSATNPDGRKRFHHITAIMRRSN